jgi:very-short-patch-repair endonuclease
MRSAQTDAERRLWSILRSHRLVGWKFKRQEQIGDYIVDFVCFQSRLIVEADGSQHVESAADERRTHWLVSQSFRVLRFWNNDILLNSDSVATAILAALETPLLPTAARRAPSSPARGEECSPSPLAGGAAAVAEPQRLGRGGYGT